MLVHFGARLNQRQNGVSSHINASSTRFGGRMSFTNEKKEHGANRRKKIAKIKMFISYVANHLEYDCMQCDSVCRACCHAIFDCR